MTIDVYNINKEVVGKMDLPGSVFGVEVSNDVIHQAVMSQEGNSRLGLAHAKDRSEVKGGGKKPWRQKGTGRARHGSNRSPIWIGGGVTFGPRNERNYSLKMNKKAKRKALFMALTSKVKGNEVMVLDSLPLAEGKTRDLNKILNTLLGDARRSVLIITPETNLNTARAAKNLEKIEVIDAKSLNIVDVLKYKTAILTKDSVKVIESHYKI